MSFKNTSMLMMFIALAGSFYSVVQSASADNPVNDLSIELVSPDDVEKISRLEEIFIQGRLARKDQSGYQSTSREFFIEGCKTCFSVCLKSSAIAAITCQEDSIGVIFYKSDKCFNTVCLEWLVIDADCQGKKIAKTAIDVFAQCVKAQTVTLRPANPKLASYYVNKCGFRRGEPDDFGGFDYVKEYEE